ncbi:5'/3'-nucleotidase SurE [Pedococcus sp. NPDC057267]|uniref:5'/3'-nucleotidase SurE n=1 Tax=Pedococcus sp. NPDC057267 TaxID=3346077 RepID=UPI0036282C39
MTVLLTNDDGYKSDGLTAARDALLAADLRVVTVAPDGPRSGGSRAATFRRPVRFDLVNDDATNPVYACDGTPVDCVRVALMSDLVPDVKVVVSGINEGANLGDDTTYSSTVGAAVEGALLGVGSIAVSQQSRDRRFRLVDREGYDWDVAGVVTAELALAACAEPLPARTIVNVNVPGSAPENPTRVVRLGRRAYRRGGLEEGRNEHGHGFFTFHVNDEEDPPIHVEPDTDFDALDHGAVALTPLSLAWGEGMPFKEIRSWTEAQASRIDHRLGLAP